MEEWPTGFTSIRRYISFHLTLQISTISKQHLSLCLHGLQTGHRHHNTTINTSFFRTSWQMSEFFKRRKNFARMQTKYLLNIHTKLLLSNSQKLLKKKPQPSGSIHFWPTVIKFLECTWTEITAFCLHTPCTGQG